MKIYVLNGPNLNMLGIREPDKYGTHCYGDLISMIGSHCRRRGIEVECYQSNHEGDLVDKIQEAYYNGACGIVINPGAYTHTSIALLDAVKALGEGIGKKSLVVSGDNPVHLAWLIPGANGHDHNNAPGVDENGMGYPFLMKRGFHDDYHEISLYLDLSNYVWDEKLDGMIEKLAAEGIRVGRWEIGLGEDYNGMCDRVGSEYWRNVLKREIAAWHSGQPNDDPELWPDGVKPAGPRPILTATKDDKIIGFTGPVDLQKSGRGWFTGICSDPEYGGKGIGSVLFNLLMREFVDEGAKFCSLFTGLDNHAQKIYMRAGLRVKAHFSVLSCPLGGSKGYEKRYY